MRITKTRTEVTIETETVIAVYVSGAGSGLGFCPDCAADVKRTSARATRRIDTTSRENKMSGWKRVMIAVPALLLCVAATQFAMQGRHGGMNNAGYLGTENAGGEGVVIGTGNHTGVFGLGTVYGVRAEARRGTGISGYALSAAGPTGAEVSGDIAGITALCPDGLAVKGTTFGGTALYGEVGPLGNGHAGYFNGRVRVNGTFSGQASGAALSVAGDTVSGTGIYGEVASGGGGHAGNRFRIAGGYRGMKVSWQVTGTRHDRYAEAYRPAVESAKRGGEAGRFLHPELYGQPAAMRIEQ